MTAPQLDLSSLRSFLDTRSIEEAYEFFAYDYGMEAEYESNGAHQSERLRFTNRFRWLREPRPECIRRFFNQVNAFYAETRAISNVSINPSEFLSVCNRLLLYRQGKRTGPRERPIEFGVRRDVDFMDPRRHFQLLWGVAPRLLRSAIGDWSAAIQGARRNIETVLVLVMALIAIHPFTDGNGRAARLAFTWLNIRYQLEPLWLAEAEDGEFLRIGDGINSTEYLMGRFVLALCDGYNLVHYAQRPSSQVEELVLKSLEANLRGLISSDASIRKTEPFQQLRDHLQKYGHIQNASPRFAALEDVIA